MKNEKAITRVPIEEKSLTGSAAVTIMSAAAAGGASAAVSQLTNHLLNRAGRPQPPKVELPPGVERN